MQLVFTLTEQHTKLETQFNTVVIHMFVFYLLQTNIHQTLMVQLMQLIGK